MWSLFKKKEDGGIFDYSGEKLPPLEFSNKKTQADVVREILDEIDKGIKIILIKGVCGTGKSAIALNLARHFKKTSIIVPIKSLQEQYETDYSQSKFILRKDNKKLKISVIKGRNNFRCPFNGERADQNDLPCTIELRERNMDKILNYIDLNDDVRREDFLSIKDVRRMSVAPCCPYWGPLLPADVKSRVLGEKKKKYETTSGKDYALFQRKKGCQYYDQYEAYIDSDVLIFNSLKYLIELAIGRKPKTDLEIIDECDEFLDNFANERKINLNRLQASIMNLPADQDNKGAIKEILYWINEVVFSEQVEIEKIRNTKAINLISKIIEYPQIAEDDEDNYYNSVFEIAKSFEHLLDETYASVEKQVKESFLGKKDETFHLNLVSINLAQRFKEIIDSSNCLVLMSGTLHSSQVLRDIFGLENFKIIEAETMLPGVISKVRTGLEKNCKYENFKQGRVTREQYLLALNACVEKSIPPTLIHVNSFEDLPSEIEISQFNLNKLISKERLKQIQEADKTNSEINKFKNKETKLLFTTKCSRGVDFAGDACNSIILTKYPYPNIQGLFWKILKKENPEKFMEFYMDKARRELIQKIARGVRFKGDHVYLLSPDSRVLDAKIG